MFRILYQALLQPSTQQIFIDGVLAVLTARSITGCLTLGLCFAILPGLVFICSPLAHELELIFFLYISEILAPLRAACAAICCIPILGLSMVLYDFLSKSANSLVAIKIGEASDQVLAALTYAISMGVSILAHWLLTHVL